MSLKTMVDGYGREVALDLERVELIRRVINSGYPGKRTYAWEVHMRCGGSTDIPCEGPGTGPGAETMEEFIYRLNLNYYA